MTKPTAAARDRFFEVLVGLFHKAASTRLRTRRGRQKSTDISSMISKQVSAMFRCRGLIAVMFLASGTTGFVAVSSPIHVPGTAFQDSGCQSVAHPKQQRHRCRVASTERSTDSNTLLDSTDTEYNGEEGDSKKKRPEVVISSEIVLPFSAEIAFDSFSNLEHQPSWSPWLRAVEYTSADRTETIWKMKRFLGVSYSWNAITRQLERPNIIEWESTKGLKNYGRVDFTEVSENETLMKLSLSFVVPRVVSKLVGKNNRIAKFVKVKMVGKSLKLFRDIVMEAEGIEKTKEKDASEEEIEDLETVDF
mmetsp:Transcript_10411/g.28780  ORF Transcript_10411/g.28780 Transcript_10411/m.28780 type:complete len:306 (+) Transcript_10411:44-961(+)